jgi:hypothetical protein
MSQTIEERAKEHIELCFSIIHKPIPKGIHVLLFEHALLLLSFPYFQITSSKMHHFSKPGHLYAIRPFQLLRMWEIWT